MRRTLVSAEILGHKDPNDTGLFARPDAFGGADIWGGDAVLAARCRAVARRQLPATAASDERSALASAGLIMPTGLRLLTAV
ncbi:MAG: hypothetical protein ACI81R_001377 [Bradymonadia bacterium]|jgi:hypothetical protein